MSYDFEGLVDHGPPQVCGPDPDPRDLEFIVQLIELSAIWLTPQPEATFTYAELFAQALELGGRELGLKEIDFRIVLGSLRTLRKLPGRRYQLK